jgi:hypothetical protein
VLQLPRQPTKEVRGVRVQGIHALTPELVEGAITAGRRFVHYEWCVSLVFVTLRRPTDIYLLGPDEGGMFRGLPFTILTFLLGWWGLPWGLFFTPVALFTNLRGGRDVTEYVAAYAREAAWAGQAPDGGGQ